VGVRSVARIVLHQEPRADWIYEWRRRLQGEPKLPRDKISRVLILCQGNLCRSPFATALLSRDRPDLETRSAGFSARDGEPADATATRVAEGLGLNLHSHRTRRARELDAGWADLILVMEGRHMLELQRRWPDAVPRARLLGDFLPTGPHRIADPWGHPDEVFKHTFAQIRAALERLAKCVGKSKGIS